MENEGEKEKKKVSLSGIMAKIQEFNNMSYAGVGTEPNKKYISDCIKEDSTENVQANTKTVNKRGRPKN